MELSEKIRLLRMENRMTQAQLADRLIVSPDLVSKWETGCRTPNYPMVLQLAELFSVDPEELIPKGHAVFTELSSCLDPSSELPEEALTKILEEFLRRQKPADSLLFLEKYYFLRSNAEIADTFGITESYVRTKLSRIRQKLKRYLKEASL